MPNMLDALRKHNYVLAVQRAREYVARHSRADLRALLADTPEDDRERLVTLIRDTLSRSPIRFGMPTLILHTSDTYDEIEFVTRNRPPPQQWEKHWWQPGECSEWARLDALPTLIRVPVDRIVSVVLAVETADALPPDNEHPTDEWWSELFGNATGTTIMSSRMALPLPDAAEAAVEVLHAALGTSPPAPPLFLSAKALDFAHKWGAEFSLRHGTSTGATGSENG